MFSAKFFLFSADLVAFIPQNMQFISILCYVVRLNQPKNVIFKDDPQKFGILEFRIRKAIDF